MTLELALLLLLQAGPAPTAIGDFDRDGLPDRAYVGTAPDGAMQLVVQPGRAGSGRIVVTRIEEPRTFEFQRVGPGTHATACGKGLGPRGAPCPIKQVTLSGDTLAFGTAESSQAVAIWNGRGFDTVWLSD